MGTFRQDVATLGDGWNKVLLNYALAMQELDKLPISNRNSWKFLGAIHGFDHDTWVQQDVIQSIDLIPAELTNHTYGDQCQHGSWFFLPWHRGYLYAFEKIVASKVKELTGDDWALPYWNYLDSTNPKSLEIPKAFLMSTLPDGTPNPLQRYPRRPGIKELQPGPRDDFSLMAMDESDFIVKDSIGFGGGITGDFVHFAPWTGALEGNPHNTVHRLVGGANGFMGNPYLAGLDPLFWLHHCNIDRLWQAWMSTQGKNMVSDPRWLEGPGDRMFVMPTIGGRDPAMTFSGRDTLRGGMLYPEYDNLTTGTRLTTGGLTVTRINMGTSAQQTVTPIGASSASVIVGTMAQHTRVDLAPGAAAAGVTRMGATEPGQEVTRIYLALESVRGSAPSPLLEVYINVPNGDDPLAHPECHASSLTLFGLNAASRGDGIHGGNGLGYIIDITDLTKRLTNSGDFDSEQMRITLVPGEQISDGSPVTVERISVLRRNGIIS